MRAVARRSLGVALLAWAVSGLAAAPLARPEAGRHEAQLCVATLPKPPRCGPAQVDLRSDGSLRLRIDDIVYTMRLRSSQVEVIVMHNVVQIDEFTVPYEWVGRSLRFNDDDRGVRYEVLFAESKRSR